MSIARSVARVVVPAMSAVAVAGAMIAGPGVALAESPVPPGSPGDSNGNGILDSSEQPDNPDLLPERLGSPVLPGSPGDTNGNGLLDSSERPDNPDAQPERLGSPVEPGSPGDTNGNGLLDSSERPDNPDL
ncbi:MULTISPECIES: hypothetical protein [unclassified Pseudonocardia]|uniref:hypothetical protein n=1 Tax=unclassified Pseudonocardia TaxID=2619320 RepID=UPI0001FFE11C|nr:hypothetical protein [Pseudonocardia sp. Ae707_Ps1]OLM20195.1 hypothetical protein Ae707Ps1_4454c [Pseudonocardia sp. Ae707_Ps1]